MGSFFCRSCGAPARVREVTDADGRSIPIQCSNSDCENFDQMVDGYEAFIER